MKEYEVYVPLTHNDGAPVDPKILVRLRDRLLEQFGGLTFFPQRNEGFWTFGGVTYRDEIVAELAALNIPKLGVMEPGKIYEW